MIEIIIAILAILFILFVIVPLAFVYIIMVGHVFKWIEKTLP